MGYKGLIVKLQKLQAYHEWAAEREKGTEAKMHRTMGKEIENVLISEEYAMKKVFKY